MTDPNLAPELDNGDMPLYVRIAARYGVSAVIAGFLVWFVTQGISGDVKGTREEVRAVRDELRQHSSEQRFFLRAICLNSAKDDAGRAMCVPNHGE